MALTQTPDTGQIEIGRTSTRVAAIAAVLLAIGLFGTVASIDVPHGASDAELLQWWQQSGNRMSGIVSGGFALLTACSVAVVVNHLRTRSAANAAPQWLAFAQSMAAATTAVWLVTGAERASIGRLVDVLDEPLPGADTLRAVTASNYALLGLAGMFVLGLLILAVSVVVLRTGTLGRWVGYVGVGCSAIMLLTVFAQYGAFTTPLAILWAVCLGVALWRDRGAYPR